MHLPDTTQRQVKDSDYEDVWMDLDNLLLTGSLPFIYSEGVYSFDKKSNVKI